MTLQQTKTKSLIGQIRTICEKYSIGEGVFSSDYVYLEKPVKIGENDNGDILCNNIHTGLFGEIGYTERSLVLNILFDENQENARIYSRDYKTSYVGYLEGLAEIGSNIKINIGIYDNFNLNKHNYTKFEIYDNALELVLDSLTQSGQTWLEHQAHLINRSKYFEQAGREYYHENRNKKDTKFEYSFLSWPERIERMKVDIEMEQLRYNHECYNQTDTLKEMLKLGQEKFDIKQENLRNKMQPILDEILNEIKKQETK